jgi:sulfur-oxidizing protein SoxZ
MAASMKVRAKISDDGITDVRILIRHDMETGLRKEKDGTLVPPHFIQNVMVKHEGRVVLTAQWGAAVSKNPYLNCQFFNGKLGDVVEVSWVDNKGQNQSASTNIIV